jgi:hypothetical protein
VVNSIQSPLVFEVELAPPSPLSSQQLQKQQKQQQKEEGRNMWDKYSNSHRALVLDAAYRPVNVINWIKAIKMDMAGRVSGVCKQLRRKQSGRNLGGWAYRPVNVIHWIKAVKMDMDMAGRVSGVCMP